MGTLVRYRARLLAAVLVASAATLAHAAPPYVKDDGGFFSGSAVSQASAAVQQIKDKHGRTVIVETVATPPAELAGRIDGNQASRDQAFLDYAQMRTASLGADVYVFVNKTPPRIEAYTRQAARSGLTDSGRDVMVKQLASAFRERNFDGGLANLTASLDKTFAAGPAAGGTVATVPPRSNTPAPAAQGREAGLPAPANTTPAKTEDAPTAGGFLGSIGCFGIVIIAVVLFLIIKVIRGFTNRNRGGPPPLGGQYGPQGGPGGGQYGQGNYPQQGYGNQGGGGFGRGIGGGILGGLLGSWIGGNVFGQGSQNSGDNSGAAGDNSGGSSDHGGGSGADFGDSGGGGSDFGGDSGGDSGGGSGSDF